MGRSTAFHVKWNLETKGKGRDNMRPMPIRERDDKTIIGICAALLEFFALIWFILLIW